MARRRLAMDEEKIARYYAEGRGAGEGAHYRPWLDFYDLSSLGLATRLPSAQTGRIHHLLSGLEAGAFLELIHAPNVVDVQEQYPLDREDTRALALELGIAHPTYPGTRVEVVMSTDLVVHRQEGNGVRRYARAVKPATELENVRVLEKLEIERRYWLRRGVDWALITDQDQTARCRVGLEWMHAKEVLEEGPHAGYWDDRIAAFQSAVVVAGKRATFDDLERDLVSRGLFQPGEMIVVIRHLCATARIAFNPELVFDMAWPVSSMPLLEDASRMSAL